MSDEALDAHLERISEPPEEMVEVEKGYLEYLEAENEALKEFLNVVRKNDYWPEWCKLEALLKGDKCPLCQEAMPCSCDGPKAKASQ